MESNDKFAVVGTCLSYRKLNCDCCSHEIQEMSTFYLLGRMKTKTFVNYCLRCFNNVPDESIML